MKLRMSRKLTYASGLLACFRCELDFTDEEKERVFAEPDRHEELIQHLEDVFQMTPLEIVAEVISRYEHLNGTAAKIFSSYNEFIGILADPEKRDKLETLQDQQAESDPLYQTVRGLSRDFRDGLLEFFFDSHSQMENLTKNYGVF